MSRSFNSSVDKFLGGLEPAYKPKIILVSPLVKSAHRVKNYKITIDYLKHKTG